MAASVEVTFTPGLMDDMREAGSALLKSMVTEGHELTQAPPPIGSPVAKVQGGTNRDSIRVESEDGPKGWTFWTLKTTSNYGLWLEVGTSRMAARPYMLPSARRAFSNGLKDFAGRLPKIWKSRPQRG